MYTVVNKDINGYFVRIEEANSEGEEIVREVEKEDAAKATFWLKANLRLQLDHNEKLIKRLEDMIKEEYRESKQVKYTMHCAKRIDFLNKRNIKLKYERTIFSDLLYAIEPDGVTYSLKDLEHLEHIKKSQLVRLVGTYVIEDYQKNESSESMDALKETLAAFEREEVVNAIADEASEFYVPVDKETLDRVEALKTQVLEEQITSRTPLKQPEYRDLYDDSNLVTELKSPKKKIKKAKKVEVKKNAEPQTVTA